MKKEEKVDKRKGKGRYWYFITIYDCVLCFGGEEYRERRYTPKPKTWEEEYGEMAKVFRV